MRLPALATLALLSAFIAAADASADDAAALARRVRPAATQPSPAAPALRVLSHYATPAGA